MKCVWNTFSAHSFISCCPCPAMLSAKMLIMFIEQTRVETTAKVAKLAKVAKVPRQKLPHTRIRLWPLMRRRARASARAAGKEKLCIWFCTKVVLKILLAACRSGRQSVSQSVIQSGSRWKPFGFSLERTPAPFSLCIDIGCGLIHTLTHTTHRAGLGWATVRANLTCVEVLNG